MELNRLVENIHERIDIIIKILFIESYLNNKNYDFFKDLYVKHIKYRTGFLEDDKKSSEDYIISFINLIKSIQLHGYKPKEPILVNKNYEILTGAHRLSCCIYFNINPQIKIREGNFKKWTYNFLNEYSFTLKEKLLITKKSQELFGLKLIILYGKHKKDFEKNIAIIKKFVKIFIEDDFKINNYNLLIQNIYSYNSTLISDIIYEKGYNLEKASNEIKILYIKSDSFETLLNLKKIIRLNYNKNNKFEVIHTPENEKENIHLSNIFLNYNSLTSIQKTKENKINKTFLANLIELKITLSQYNINNYCIVGSAVLEAVGVHKSGDIDIIVNLKTKKKVKDTVGAIKLSKNIDIVCDNYNDQYSEDEIINNSEYHFYFMGFKFANLEIIKSSKSKGLRKKDLEHIKKIDSIILEKNKSIFNELHYIKIKIRRVVLKNTIIITKRLGLYNSLSKIWRKYILRK